MNRKKLQKLTDTLTKNCKHCTPFCLLILAANILAGDGHIISLGLTCLVCATGNISLSENKKNRFICITLNNLCSYSVSVNKFEVKCLIKLYYNLVGDIIERQGVVNGLDRNAFRNFLHVTFGMTDDMIMDRVFRGFDKDNDGCVSVSEWVYGLSLFLRGTLEEKMKYCFEVFDLNGDGFISKEEMFHMLKNSLLKQPSEEDPDEGIKDLVEITLKKMDHDHDGKLSFSDYEQAVREETLLLEAFGPCLPDPKSQMEFEVHIFKDPNEYIDI